MPEDFDVQPPDVYEDNADAVQEPPCISQAQAYQPKKKEAAAPEETVTEEVPAETTGRRIQPTLFLIRRNLLWSLMFLSWKKLPLLPYSFSSPAPALPPARRGPVLTIRSRDDVETAEDRDDVIWHEIHNAYRTRKIITGKLGGIEQLDNRKTVAVVDYKGGSVSLSLSRK